MRFVSKVVAKILSDKERVKQQQRSAEEIKEGLKRGGKNTVSFDSKDKEDKEEKKKKKAPNYSKRGLVLVPDAFKNKMLKLSKSLNEKHVENLLSHGDWISEEALKGLLERYDDSSIKEEQDFAEIVRKLIDQEHDEPYTGDLQNAAWRTNGRSLSEKKIQKFGVVPRLVKDLKGTLGKDVPHGGTDPLAWIDSKYKVSLKLIQSHKGKPLTINTRSDLIGHDDYMEALDQKKHKIRMHFLTDDGNIGRRVEPGAASFKRRMAAVKKLADAGFDVTAVVDAITHKDAPDILKDLANVTHEDLKKETAGTKIKLAVNKVKINDEALMKVLTALGIAHEKKVS